jgi:hypothetical protein
MYSWQQRSRPYLIYYRDLLAYVYIRVVQRELDVFRECVWNNHRTHTQKGKELPAGVPDIEIIDISPVYTTLNFWYSTDKIGTRTTFLVLGLPI